MRASKPPTDMRRIQRDMNRRLLMLVLFVLVVVGGGLIAVLYGAPAGLLGLVRGRTRVGSTVVACAVEHSAVLRAADWVPRSVRTRARAVESATRALEQQLLRQVTDEDVADELGWETGDVRTVRAQVALSHVAALDSLGVETDTLAVESLAGEGEATIGQSLEARRCSLRAQTSRRE